MSNAPLAMKLTSTSIRQLRVDLGLTQAQMASLMNIHPVTMSRWETPRENKYTPSIYQNVLLRAFQRACEDDPTIKHELAKVLLGFGAPAALFFVLRATFGKADFS